MSADLAGDDGAFSILWPRRRGNLCMGCNFLRVHCLSTRNFPNREKIATSASLNHNHPNRRLPNGDQVKRGSAGP